MHDRLWKIAFVRKMMHYGAMNSSSLVEPHTFYFFNVTAALIRGKVNRTIKFIRKNKQYCISSLLKKATSLVKLLRIIYWKFWRLDDLQKENIYIYIKDMKYWNIKKQR